MSTTATTTTTTNEDKTMTMTTIKTTIKTTTAQAGYYRIPEERMPCRVCGKSHTLGSMGWDSGSWTCPETAVKVVFASETARVWVRDFQAYC